MSMSFWVVALLKYFPYENLFKICRKDASVIYREGGIHEVDLSVID